MQFRSSLYQFEKCHFAWSNSSFTRIGTASSPFCSFFVSRLQLRAPYTTISALVDQINFVRNLNESEQ